MLESQSSTLRSELRLKDGQLAQVTAACEETRAQLAKATADLETANAKVHVTQGEYVSLQAASNSRIRELTGEVADLSKRVAQYESLEKELDATLEAGATTGAAPGADGTGGSGGGNALAAALAALSDAIPASTQRRAEHIVRLTTRIRQMTGERAELAAELERLKTRELPGITRELEEARAQLALTQQPYNFLVQGLAEKDRELTLTSAALEKAKVAYRETREREKARAKECKRLKTELDQALELHRTLHNKVRQRH